MITAYKHGNNIIRAKYLAIGATQMPRKTERLLPGSEIATKLAPSRSPWGEHAIDRELLQKKPVLWTLYVGGKQRRASKDNLGVQSG